MNITTAFEYEFQSGEFEGKKLKSVIFKSFRHLSDLKKKMDAGLTRDSSKNALHKALEEIMLWEKNPDILVVCPFCGEKRVRFFSYNSSREDVYFSDSLVSCEECIPKLEKRVSSHCGRPVIVPIRMTSVFRFLPKFEKKVLTFLKKIISHPR